MKKLPKLQPKKLKKPSRQKPKLAILGIDEVGRGPWAGPLVVGACVLGDTQIDGLTDSKKLTAKKREALAPTIREKAAVGLGWVSAEELDKIGMTAALCKACREAVKQIHVPFHEIIIDGTINFLRDTPLASHVQVLTKADLLVPEVSAASIVAKVARDEYMYKLAEKYPGYGFEKHVGYGTAAHKKALEELGVCPEHRKSFKPIAALLGIDLTPKKSTRSTKARGDKGEDAVCNYLIKSGHEIVARNWKNKFCEIDIVSKFNGVLCFTEVKYRKAGSGLDAIDKKKLEKMRFAAEFYLAKNGGGAAILAAAEVSGDNYEVTDFLVLQ
ncbi:ribonuclease HII [Candidatus Saccharibacteria bacterium]|nr:ribonuclease HII [Candidatus Saccharibacteria bacterium]